MNLASAVDNAAWIKHMEDVQAKFLRDQLVRVGDVVGNNSRVTITQDGGSWGAAAPGYMISNGVINHSVDIPHSQKAQLCRRCGLWYVPPGGLHCDCPDCTPNPAQEQPEGP